MKFDTHNLRVGLETARSSLHDLNFQLQHEKYNTDPEDDDYWTIDEAEDLTFSLEETIEGIQETVSHLISKLEAINKEETNE